MVNDDTKEQGSLSEIDSWTGGFSWIAYPEERGKRASHALLTEGGVWLVDPVDVDGLDERVAKLGNVTGVLVLQDRHTRDAAEVARRHDVAVFIPEWMTLAREKLDAEAEPVGSNLPGSNYTVHRLIERKDWEEAVLVDETTKTLVVPEAIGTLPSFGKNDTELGVHPSVDEPPHKLADWNPDRILVGHGTSVHDDANRQLRAALDVE
ncbi:MAG: hypothetical protein U5K70_00870 [Halodesulfurarchaeum sp.]|nr:hypothetical protein [Halodesulfurarchaeum sp.]